MINAQNIQELKDNGFTVFNDMFSKGELRIIKRHLKSLNLNDANITHGDANYRSDKTHWLSTEDYLENEILNKLSSVKTELNKNFFMNLKEVESHIACYPVGSKYGKHRDSQKVNNKRVVSLITYLNDEWDDNNGGELVLHLKSGSHKITPSFPSTVMLLSEEIEHEVLETKAERWSIATWFRN